MLLSIDHIHAPCASYLQGPTTHEQYPRQPTHGYPNSGHGHHPHYQEEGMYLQEQFYNDEHERKYTTFSLMESNELIPTLDIEATSGWY
jgi:hypothetical protein